MKQFTRAVVSAALCAALSLACTLPAYAAEGEMLEVNEDISISAFFRSLILSSYIESCAISTPFVSHWISACVLLMILALNLIFCAGKIVFFKLKF